MIKGTRWKHLLNTSEKVLQKHQQMAAYHYIYIWITCMDMKHFSKILTKKYHSRTNAKACLQLSTINSFQYFRFSRRLLSYLVSIHTHMGTSLHSCLSTSFFVISCNIINFIFRSQYLRILTLFSGDRQFFVVNFLGKSTWVYSFGREVAHFNQRSFPWFQEGKKSITWLPKPWSQIC